MDPTKRALPLSSHQPFIEDDHNLHPPALRRRKEQPQDLTLDDLPDLCLMKIMEFAQNPGILKQVSRRWYTIQTLEQLASHPSRSIDYKDLYPAIPLGKLNLVEQMVLFTPEKTEKIFDLTPLVCSPVGTPTLSSLRQESYTHFAKFKAAYPAEAAMLCSPSIFHILSQEATIEALYQNSPQELAALLAKVWEEKVSTKEKLNLLPEHVLALSEKIARMPNLQELIISHLNPTLAAAYPMINSSFFPPNFIAPPHQEECIVFSFIGQLQSLRRLEICGVSSFQLPENLSHLHNLSTVSLTRNHLSNIPHGILSLLSLHNLDLQDNDFTSFPLELTKLSQRTFVDLRGNPITTQIPKLFFPMIRENRLLLDSPECEEIRQLSSFTTRGRSQRPQAILF